MPTTARHPRRFERELRAYQHYEIADHVEDETLEIEELRATADPDAARFLREIRGLPLKGRVLITSRLLPKELESGANVIHNEVASLSLSDTIAFFHAQGIKGTRSEIRTVCVPYGFHPLALRLLTGLAIKDLRHPRDVRALMDHQLTINAVKQDDRRHHVFQVSYDALSEDRRHLLGTIAAFRYSIAFDTLVTIEDHIDKQEIRDALKELIERGLISFDPDHGRLDLHPIVRRYAYENILNPKDVHEPLRLYFAKLANGLPKEVNSLSDLTPAIERYYHTVKVGYFDHACDILCNDLINFLYYKFSAYHIMIELLSMLFPDGECQRAGVCKENNEWWSRNYLALCYECTGQTQKALDQWKLQLASNDWGCQENYCKTLNGLARAYFQNGQLSAAENHFRQLVDLSRNCSEFDQATNKQDLGAYLTILGQFQEACTALNEAYQLFDKLHADQSLSIVERYRAKLALLSGQPSEALLAAHRARELIERHVASKSSKALECNHYPRDFSQVNELIGLAIVTLAAQQGTSDHEQLQQAESYLQNALELCRQCSLLEFEPSILLSWAKWHQLQGNREQAIEYAEEALEIAERCKYRLKQADIHNFRAQLALDNEESEKARDEANKAKDCGRCDGPPHYYKFACDEADRLLAGLD